MFCFVKEKKGREERGGSDTHVVFRQNPCAHMDDERERERGYSPVEVEREREGEMEREEGTRDAK